MIRFDVLLERERFFIDFDEEDICTILVNICDISLFVHFKTLVYLGSNSEFTMTNSDTINCPMDYIDSELKRVDVTPLLSLQCCLSTLTDHSKLFIYSSELKLRTFYRS